MLTDQMLGLAIVVLLSAAACSASDGNDLADPGASGTAEVSVPSSAQVAEGEGEPTADVDAVGPTTTEFDLAAQPSTPVIAPIPDTGVPGIDSDDEFCRAWSEYGGSFQALTLLSAIGEPAAAYRLEVIASSSVVSALESMSAALPAELESERKLFISDLLGPFASRAMAAAEGLSDASVDLDVLSEAWLMTLRETGLDDPNMTVVLPESVDAVAVEGVVSMFAAAFPLIVDDPALILDVFAPLTTDYLAANCPDGGVLAGNDDVS